MGANPLLSWPDTHAVHQALSALDFLAVSELFMTPTAMMADIVFPAASFMEYEGITQGLDGSVRYQPKLAQTGNARPDHQIVAAIGETMGVLDPQSDTAYWMISFNPEAGFCHRQGTTSGASSRIASPIP